jgi:hypothetical protein
LLGDFAGTQISMNCGTCHQNFDSPANSGLADIFTVTTSLPFVFTTENIVGSVQLFRLSRAP